MFPMMSRIDAILDSPYFSAVISSVTKAASKYLFDDSMERKILFGKVALAAGTK